jgi:predicted transcriptional regulator
VAADANPGVRYLRSMDEDRDLAILAEEDDATLLAIDEGIRSADAGRLIPIEEVERLLPEWISKYSTAPKR